MMFFADLRRGRRSNPFTIDLSELVRGSVEGTLNGLFDAEADELVGAKRHERNDKRRDTRAGHYERKVYTQAGEVISEPSSSGN